MPGGPTIRTPAGSRAPALAYLPGSRSIETISCTSPLAVSMPATSSNVRSVGESCSAEPFLPTDPVEPPSCRRIIVYTRPSHRHGKRRGSSAEAAEVAAARKSTPLRCKNQITCGRACTTRWLSHIRRPANWTTRQNMAERRMVAARAPVRSDGFDGARLMVHGQGG